MDVYKCVWCVALAPDSSFFIRSVIWWCGVGVDMGMGWCDLGFNMNTPTLRQRNEREKKSAARNFLCFTFDMNAHQCIAVYQPIHGDLREYSEGLSIIIVILALLLVVLTCDCAIIAIRSSTSLHLLHSALSSYAHAIRVYLSFLSVLNDPFENISNADTLRCLNILRGEDIKRHCVLHQSTFYNIQRRRERSCSCTHSYASIQFKRCHRVCAYTIIDCSPLTGKYATISNEHTHILESMHNMHHPDMHGSEAMARGSELFRNGYFM